MTTHTIEDLTEERLDSIADMLMDKYETAKDVEDHIDDIRKIPDVKELREAYFELIRKGEEVAQLISRIIHNISEDQITTSGKDVVTSRHKSVEVLCYEHDIPLVIARATLPLDADANTHYFVPKELTNSYHLEGFKSGKIYCNEHPQEDGLIKRVGETFRISSHASTGQTNIEDKIIQEFSQRLGLNNETVGNLKKELEIIFCVGRDGIYESLYEGFEQIRSRAITAPFIAVNARLDLLSDNIKRLINYGEFSKANSHFSKEDSHLKRVRVLRERPFFRILEEVVAENVPSPHMVIKYRVKGTESFTEKLFLSKHWDAIKNAYHNENLKEYSAELIGREIREPKDPPNLWDYVSVRVLLHDDSLNYDYFNLEKRIGEEGGINITDVQRHSLEEKMYDAFESLTGVDLLHARFPEDGVAISPGLRVKNHIDDYISEPKPTGYTGLHAIVESTDSNLEGAVVELQFNPNYWHNLEIVSGERDEYKATGAVMLRYLREKAEFEKEWQIYKAIFSNGEFNETKIAMEPHLL